MHTRSNKLIKKRKKIPFEWLNKTIGEIMTTLILTLLFACGDKEETDTSSEEVVEDTAASEEE